MDLEEKTLASRPAFDGRLLHLRVDTVELPNGEQSIREVVHHPGGVCVLPLHSDGEVTLVEQFRYPYHKTLLEVPAGKLEPGEDPFDAIRRELSEETGLEARAWLPLGEFYPTPGYTDEVLHLYLARELTAGATHPDADEFLRLRRIPLDELVSMAARGELPDGKTMALVLRVRRLLDEEAQAQRTR